ncbi:MAG: hypothetical protein WD851_12610 [Pirellulales bacterium]
MSPVDMSDTARDEDPSRQALRGKQRDRVVDTFDAALALLASHDDEEHADNNPNTAEQTSDPFTVGHSSNAIHCSSSALAVDWSALGESGASRHARNDATDPILKPPRHDAASTPPASNTLGGGGSVPTAGSAAGSTGDAGAGGAGWLGSQRSEAPSSSASTAPGAPFVVPPSGGTSTPNAGPPEGGTTSEAPALALVDASGQPISIAPDANTLVVGAATWCGACAAFKEALAAPGIPAQLADLRIVFAFGDEGGTGPGGVETNAFLENLPGDVAFLAEGSVRCA